MEENAKNIQQHETEVHKTQYTREQTVLYTLVSIALFCLLYFGGKWIISVVNRPYYMIQYSETVSEENLNLYFEESKVSENCGLTFENARITKQESGYILSILFSGIENKEEFAENGILFRYGNPIEEVSTEIYPYAENPTRAEYANATKYVNIDNPNDEILVFEYRDNVYVKYQTYGYSVPTDVKILFNDCEKVY